MTGKLLKIVLFVAFGLFVTYNQKAVVSAGTNWHHSQQPPMVEWSQHELTSKIRYDSPPPSPPPDILERVPKVMYSAMRELSTTPITTSHTHLYSDSKTLVLIYNTYRKYDSDPAPTDYVTADEVDILREEIKKSREFIWRHSHAKFNMQITDLVVIDRDLTLDQFWQINSNAYWLPYWSSDSEHSVAQDMVDLGLMGKGYDCVIVLYAWKNTENAGAAYGGAMYGVGIEALDGAAYIAIPLEWGIEGKRGVIVHEYLHVIDSLFEANGEPDFPNTDRPKDYSGDYNFGWEFNAWMLQTWPIDKWLDTGAYSTVMSALDDDNDGFPDQGTDGAGANLSVTELSFGSSADLADTDNDGLLDIDELIADVFESSNPLIRDTDNDGLIDGKDLYPIFPVETDRLSGTPVIDGILSSGEHSSLGSVSDITGSDLNAELYFEWDSNYLYISAIIQDDYVDGGFSGPWWNDHLHIRIDANNDGYAWHGDDNLEVYIGPKGGGNQPFAYPRILHADGTIDTTTITAADLVFEIQVTDIGYVLELAIPAIPDIGLVPENGYTFGYNTYIRDFDSVDWSWPGYDLVSGKLEFPSFVDLTLVSSDPTDAVKETLQEAGTTVNGLDIEVFKKKNQKKKLTRKINRALNLTDMGNYLRALKMLRKEILKRLDGCAAFGKPDRNDWIKDCDAQNQVYLLSMKATGYLEEIVYLHAVTETLQEAGTIVNGLDTEVFKKKKQKKLSRKINRSLKLADKLEYRNALKKVRKEVLIRMNGCAASGQPDRNDWIKDCDAQNQVYLLIMKATGYLGEII